MAMLWDFVEDDIDDSAVWDGVSNPISELVGAWDRVKNQLQD
jgi:hypothetical protein